MIEDDLQNCFVILKCRPVLQGSILRAIVSREYKSGLRRLDVNLMIHSPTTRPQDIHAPKKQASKCQRRRALSIGDISLLRISPIETSLPLPPFLSVPVSCHPSSPNLMSFTSLHHAILYNRLSS